MTYALTIAIVVQTVTFLITMRLFLADHARQVADLCQRLQAPETAVAQHVVDLNAGLPVQHLPFDDDAAWMKYATEIGTDPLA